MSVGAYLYRGAVLVAGLGFSLPQTATGQAAPGPDPDALQEVIVTATRRTESAMDVPASVSVISAADIDRLHATSLMDLAGAVPGLAVGSTGGSPGQTSIVLRGMPSISSGSLVANFIDDVDVGSSAASTSQSAFELDLLPYDIERIEVLYGPQGTLYGANSMGGVLTYVTKYPDLTSSEVQIGGDLFGIKNGGSVGTAERGAWSLPLIDGALAMRASVYGQQTPGYIENPLRGLNHENSLAQDGGRVALLWQPWAAMQVKVQGIYQKIASEGDANIFAEQLGTPQDAHYTPGAWLGGDLVYPHALAEPFNSTLKFFSGTVDWSTPVLRLVSVTGYWDKQLDQVQDNSMIYGYLQPMLDPNVTSQLNRFRNYVGVKRFSQELRLVSPSGQRLEWLGGVYYCHESDTSDQFNDALDSDLRPIPALTPFYESHSPSTYTEAAIFGSLTYRISERFDVTGGLRWSSNRQYVNTDVPPNEIAPAVNSVARSAEQPTTYDFSVRYHLLRETMTYLRIASGYRPGSPNQVIPAYPEIPRQTMSDTMVNYEVGIKSELSDRKASVNLAIYKIDWSDIQVEVPTADGFFYYGINAGNAISEGVEFTANWWPVEALHFGGNAAYADVFATGAVPNADIFVGTRMPNSPKWTAAATADMTLGSIDHWTARISGNWRYIAPELSSLSTAPPVGLSPGYSWFDADLRLTRARVEIALYAKNLADKRAFNNAGPFTASTGGPNQPPPPGPPSPSFGGVPIEPRVVGLSLTVTF